MMQPFRFAAGLRAWLLGCLWLTLALSSSLRAQDVVISEIMYHPASENPREKYVEIYNRALTNVNLSGWVFSKGFNYSFPSNTLLRATNYLVVAADLATFNDKYPTVTNVVGGFLVVRTTNVVGYTYTNYQNSISSSSDQLDLKDASGNVINTVTYADEGDWAVRKRGPLDRGYNGWVWFAEADGTGKSLELIATGAPNFSGQNWQASAVSGGTPGRINSVAATNLAPLILEVAHSPVVPLPTDPVTVSARILDEGTNVTVRLFWRVNMLFPFGFASTNMVDDGAHGDGLAGDKVFGAVLPPQPQGTIIEFYVQATDSGNRSSTWPRPAQDQNGFSVGQLANALYQVDTNIWNGVGPLHKFILTLSESVEFSNLLAGTTFFQSPESDATYNVTFINVDALGLDVRYQSGLRNRGHGSRYGEPHNYRLDFPGDARWHGLSGLNLNALSPHLQVFGSALLLKSGVVGNESRAVQLRFNGGAGPGGTPAYGRYAANEAADGDFAANHFPDDASGNIYTVIRDLEPSSFAYRTPAAFPSGTYRDTYHDVNRTFINFGPEDARTYSNTYFKDSNGGQNDYTDIVALSRILGTNDLFTPANVRAVIDPEQWLTHVAAMAILNNQETGINSGWNDDYELYRGIDDPRFRLMFHDLDTINAGSINAGLFGSTANNGIRAAFTRFLRSPEFEPLYYQTLQRLINTTFSKPAYDSLIAQVLGPYVPANVITTLRGWMDARRSYVQQNFLNPYFAVNPPPPTATVAGEPRSPTPFTSATLTVGGVNVFSYKYRLNDGAYGAETPVSTPITLTGLTSGSTNVVAVIGRSPAGSWQSISSPTVSKVWVVNIAIPAVRLNEVLAQNSAALNVGGTFPDAIELFNEGAESVDLAGLHLSNDSSNPAKYTFPVDTVLAAGSYLVVYANNPDGTPGLHVGFTLNAEGDEVYLSDRDINMTRLDAVKFGLQLPDWSVGRFDGAGEWKLAQPSFGGANVAQPTGSLAALRINEWLAAGVAPFTEDFIELYNHNAAPVDIGRCYFTDEPTGAPTRHQIPPLTFMAGNSFLAFTADGTKGPRHVNFSLKADGDQIGFLDPAQKPVDVVLFGPQKSGVSEGRCPDGLNTFGPLATPTPGAPNVCATVVALRYDSVWKYDATGTDRGTTWKDIDYDDSAWPSGAAVLGYSDTDSNSLPEFILTALPISNTRTTYYFRTTFVLPASVAAVQMTHIIDDGAVFFLNGQELGYNYNMPQGTVSATTFAQARVATATNSSPISLPIELFQPGTNWLAVEVHQYATNSSDVAFALKLEITPGITSGGGLVLNEILANNHTLAEPDGTTPDWVEIFNATDAAIDLSDFSLTDDVTNPRRYVFPTNTLLASQSHLRVLFDSATPVSAVNAGFRLKSTGDSMYLFNAPAAGAGLVDFLTYGLQAADYSLGRIPDGGTNWVLNVPTPAALNTAAALGDPLQLKINEWLANPSSGEDLFEIFNPSAQPVALAGLWLTDDLRSPAARMKSKIPRLSFIGTGFQGYQEFIADRLPLNGPDHVNFSLGASGESLGISQGNGTLINGVTFGAQALGVSQGRFPDGATALATFPASASFGEMNWLPLTSLVINEVLTHTDPPVEDAIELFNSSAASVNLAGWYLSNSKDNLKKYPITNALTIPAGGFRVFYETQFNHSALAPNNFTLNSAHGGDVYLSAATNGVLTGYRTHVSFEAAENGVSFGRYKNSVGQNDFVAMSARTFGVDSPVGVAQFRTGGGLPNAYPKVGPVVFSEIMSQPPLLGTNDNTRDEFIELFNPTAAAVPLFDPVYPTNRWRLRGGVDFDFPPEFSLGATSALLIVSFDPTNDLVALADFKMAHGLTSDVPILGPWIGKLSNGGESLSLQKPDAVQLAPHPDAGFVPYITVEKLSYGSVLPWPTNAAGTGRSLQRVSLSGYGNDPTNWSGAASAPGRAGRAAPTEECIFALSSARAAFKPAGGVSNVMVLGPENCPWEVVNTNSWIQITGGPSGFGSGVVYYTVTKNIKLRPRTGMLLIAGQPFLVIQSDTGKPAVTLVAPTAKLKVFTNASVTLQGTAKDLVGVARVEYSLNSGSYQAASGTTNWTAGITLLAGKNVLRVRSVDLADNLSAVLARTWRYNPPAVPVAGLALRRGAILPGPDRRANFVFQVSPGSNYVLWSSADLVHWESLGVHHAATSTLTFTNLFDPSLQQKFFKLQPVP